MTTKRNAFQEVDLAALCLGFNLHHPGNPEASKRAATAYGQHLATMGTISPDNAKYIMTMKLHGGTSNGAEAHFNGAGTAAEATKVPPEKARSSKKATRKA